MTIKEAADRLTHAFAQSMLNGGGAPEEADNNLNNASRNVIKAYYTEKGDVWLVRINPFNKADALMEQYDPHQIVYNFACEAVVPSYDETLHQLLKDRLSAEYTGTWDDSVRLKVIEERIEALGGRNVIWS